MLIYILLTLLIRVFRSEENNPNLATNKVINTNNNHN
jgi:hypothetical protein